MKASIQKICAASNVNWIPLTYTRKPPVLSTLWDYRKMIKAAKKLHRVSTFDIVHCRSYIAGLVGLQLKKKYGIKFLFDMRGFWADERVDGGLWNLKNPLFRRIYKFFKAKERTFLLNADYVISLTEAAKKEMLHWSIDTLKPEKIAVIPCAADFELFSLVNPQKNRVAKMSLGFKPQDFVLSYVGSIGTWYLLDEMIQFFKLLKEKVPNAKYLILTPEDKSQIEKALKSEGIHLEDVVIRYAQRADIPGFVHASSLNIFFIKPAYSKIASSPTKLGEVLAMGIPVLCNSGVGDVEKIIKDTGAGYCIPDFKSVTFQNIVDRITKNFDFNGKEIRERASDIFDLRVGVRSYQKVYENMLQEKHWQRQPIENP